MATERTPLWTAPGPSRAANQATNEHRSSPTLNDLASRHIVRAEARSHPEHHGNDGPVSDVPTGSELPSLLYALYLLSEPKTSATPRGIRAHLADLAVRTRTRGIIIDEIERYLDTGTISHIEHDGTDQDSSVEDDNEDEDRDEVVPTLWRQWVVESGHNRSVSAVDLMLPPPWNVGVQFLTHRLVRHVVEKTWREGVPPLQSEGDEEVQQARNRDQGWKEVLLSRIAPRRLHLLDLISFLVLYGVTLGIAISPRSWITPFDSGIPQRRRIHPAEVVYIIWSIATFMDACTRHRLLRSVFLLPSLLATMISFSSSSTSYNILCLSIPFLSILLSLPSPPSLPFLHADLLPLSTLLVSIIRRSLTSLGLILPLLVALFIVFSWSMNGDIYRGFFSILSTPTDLAPDSPEIGIAPYQARLAIFVAFVVLLILCIILGTARSSIPPASAPGVGASSDDDGLERDPSEAEYGSEVALRSRIALTSAVRDGLAQRLFVPLNLLDLPLIISAAALHALPVDEGTRGKVTKWTQERRLELRALILGPPCALLWVMDRLLSFRLIR